MYLNKVTLIGNLTRNPELKAMPSGNSVTSFSLATNRTWKDQSGAKQEAVEYHDVVAFGKTAKIIAQYATKGSQLLVEGRLQTRLWEDKDTAKKMYRTEIIADKFQFGSKSSSPAEESQEEKDDKKFVESTTEKRTEPSEDYPDGINLDDIPF